MITCTSLQFNIYDLQEFFVVQNKKAATVEILVFKVLLRPLRSISLLLLLIMMMTVMMIKVINKGLILF